MLCVTMTDKFDVQCTQCISMEIGECSRTVIALSWPSSLTQWQLSVEYQPHCNSYYRWLSLYRGNIFFITFSYYDSVMTSYVSNNNLLLKLYIVDNFLFKIVTSTIWILGSIFTLYTRYCTIFKQIYTTCKKYKCNENRNVILLTSRSREVRKKTLMQMRPWSWKIQD